MNVIIENKKQHFLNDKSNEVSKIFLFHHNSIFINRRITQIQRTLSLMYLFIDTLGFHKWVCNKCFRFCYTRGKRVTECLVWMKIYGYDFILRESMNRGIGSWKEKVDLGWTMFTITNTDETREWGFATCIPKRNTVHLFFNIVVGTVFEVTLYIESGSYIIIII